MDGKVGQILDVAMPLGAAAFSSYGPSYAAGAAVGERMWQANRERYDKKKQGKRLADMADKMQEDWMKAQEVHSKARLDSLRQEGYEVDPENPTMAVPVYQKADMFQDEPDYFSQTPGQSWERTEGQPIDISEFAPKPNASIAAAKEAAAAGDPAAAMDLILGAQKEAAELRLRAVDIAGEAGVRAAGQRHEVALRQAAAAREEAARTEDNRMRYALAEREYQQRETLAGQERKIQEKALELQIEQIGFQRTQAANELALLREHNDDSKVLSVVESLTKDADNAAQSYVSAMGAYMRYSAQTDEMLVQQGMSREQVNDYLNAANGYQDAYNSAMKAKTELMKGIKLPGLVREGPGGGGGAGAGAGTDAPGTGTGTGEGAGGAGVSKRLPPGQRPGEPGYKGGATGELDHDARARELRDAERERAGAATGAPPPPSGGDGSRLSSVPTGGGTVDPGSARLSDAYPEESHTIAATLLSTVNSLKSNSKETTIAKLKQQLRNNPAIIAPYTGLIAMGRTERAGGRALAEVTEAVLGSPEEIAALSTALGISPEDVVKAVADVKKSLEPDRPTGDVASQLIGARYHGLTN